MASKKKQAEPTDGPPVRKRQDPADREPREGLKDEKSLAEAEDAGTEDNGSDESQERNEAVDAEMDDEEESLGLRSVRDGGFEDEELPEVRIGEVYEATRPDDHRRYVKVIGFEDDGRVRVKNEETYHESLINPANFARSAGWWRRYAS
jgi:hypothetical protein